MVRPSVTSCDYLSPRGVGGWVELTQSPIWTCQRAKVLLSSGYNPRNGMTSFIFQHTAKKRESQPGARRLIQILGPTKCVPFLLQTPTWWTIEAVLEKVRVQANKNSIGGDQP